MRFLRGALTVSLSVSLCSFSIPVQAAGKPLGLLTLVYNARLNTAEAFAGLSVFPGEEMATDPDGKAMVRIGSSTATLGGDSGMVLEPCGEGAHVDLEAGSVYVSSAKKNPLEVHAEDALVRAHGEQDVQARVLMFAPMVLQITTRVGSLEFSYHGEFRVLPEGQTYRIYLDAESEPAGQGPAGAGAGKSGTEHSGGLSKGAKVAYFIVAGVGTGLAAWGIHDIIESRESAESPAKP